MNCEASPLMNCENPTSGSHFSGESTNELQMTFPNFREFRIMSDNGILSDIVYTRQARRMRRGTG